MQEYKTKWQEAQRDLQAQLNTAKKVTYILSFFLFYDHFTSQTLMHVEYYHETGTFYHYLTCLCYKMI